MATAVLALTSPIDNDAKFRGLAEIGTAIVGLGWVRCSDTGQIDWTTVTKPTSGTYVQSGYEIFRMADTHQAAAPVYLRIDYGTGSVLISPCFWLTIGTGSDGAGTLTGTTSLVARLTANATTGPTVEALLSGGPGRLSFSIYGWEFLCSIERLKDTAGADTATGISFSAWGTSANCANTGNKIITFSPNVYSHPLRDKAPALVPDGTTWQNGANVGIAPLIPCGITLLNPLTDLLAYLDNDITATNQISLSTYGTVRNYYALGARGSKVGGSNTNMRFLMRYE